MLMINLHTINDRALQQFLAGQITLDQLAAGMTGHEPYYIADGQVVAFSLEEHKRRTAERLRAASLHARKQAGDPPAAVGFPLCRFMVDTGKRASRCRTCRGNIAVCRHPDRKPTRCETKTCTPIHCASYEAAPRFRAHCLLGSAVRGTPAYNHLRRLCRLNGVELTSGDRRNGYRRQMRENRNVITWGVKWTDAQYKRWSGNVLFVENGLLAQNAGAFVDAGGYWTHSDLVRGREWQIVPTEAERRRLGRHLAQRFNFGPDAAPDPTGPILIALQTYNDAPMRHYFPLQSPDRCRLQQVLALCAEHLPADIPVRVRPHPKKKWYWREHLDDLKAAMRPDWTIDDSPDVYDLLRSCRALVTVNSTLATEALGMRMPVATLGLGTFTGAGVTLECAEDPSRLGQIETWQPPPPAVEAYLCAVLRHQLQFFATFDQVANNIPIRKWIDRILSEGDLGMKREAERAKYEHIYMHQEGFPRRRDGAMYGSAFHAQGLLARIETMDIQSICDVGTGNGEFPRWMADNGCPVVYGTDLVATPAGEGVVWFRAPARLLPLPDNAVEYISAFDVLEHVVREDLALVLQEFCRTAAKGLLLSVGTRPSHTKINGSRTSLHPTRLARKSWARKLARYGDVEQIDRYFIVTFKQREPP